MTFENRHRDLNNPTRTTYLDPADIYRRYDEAVTQFYRIPFPAKKGEPPVRIWEMDELQNLEVQRLRLIADSLQVSSASDRKDVLIKAIRNAQFVPVVMATPSPAYANQELTTGRKEGSKKTSNIRYPIITVLRLPAAYDQSRFKRANYRKLTWYGSDNAVLQGWKPTPILMSYQIEVEATLQTHMNWLDQAIERLWSSRVATVHSVLDIDLGDPWGEKTILAFKDNYYSDETEYEQPAENAERLVRHIYTMHLEAWLPTPVWAVPTVRKFIEQYFDGYKQILLEEVTETSFE